MSSGRSHPCKTRRIIIKYGGNSGTIRVRERRAVRAGTRGGAVGATLTPQKGYATLEGLGGDRLGTAEVGVLPRVPWVSAVAGTLIYTKCSLGRPSKASCTPCDKQSRDNARQFAPAPRNQYIIVWRILTSLCMVNYCRSEIVSRNS